MQQFMRSGGDNQVTTKVTTQPTPSQSSPSQRSRKTSSSPAPSLLLATDDGRRRS